DSFDTVLQAPLLQRINQRLAGARVPEINRADFYGTCARQHELDHIFSRADAADADHGNFHRFGRLPHHAQRDRLYGRAGEAGGNVRDSWLAGLGVDRHGDEGIYQRDSVRACVLGGAGYVGNAGYVGRKLHDQGARGDFLHCADHFEQHFGVTAEADASAFGVGARDIQLVGGNTFALVEDAYYVFILLLRVPENIAEENDVADFAEQWKFFFQERWRADVLQAYGVQHSGGGFEQTRMRITGHGLAREALGDEAAKAVQGDYILEFHTVAEASAGRHHGILQRNAGDIDAHIEPGLRGRTHACVPVIALLFREAG